MLRSAAAFATLAVTLAGTPGARASEQAVKFKEYALGMTASEMKRHGALTCKRPKADPGIPDADPALRQLQKQGLQMFVFESGEMICAPKKAETAVGLPVTTEFAFFSERLEQITVRFPRKPGFDRFDFNADHADEIRMLIAGLVKRYGPYESRQRRICPRGFCRHGTDEYTYTWHGSNGRIALSFSERPSAPATLKYTSPTFDSASAQYAAKRQAVARMESERRAKLKAAGSARHARDF